VHHDSWRGHTVRPISVARELGATHVVNGAETDAVEEIKDITGCGTDYSLDSTGVPTVFRQAVDAP
jgi:aryl-alcohol dehydrogenase